jgi:hypothetical protein
VLEGVEVDASTRGRALEPFLQSMHYLRRIRRYNDLSRTCVTQRRDFTFNSHAIWQALKEYPETEKSSVLKAVVLARDIAGDVVLETRQKLESWQSEGLFWKGMAHALSQP